MSIRTAAIASLLNEVARHDEPRTVAVSSEDLRVLLDAIRALRPLVEIADAFDANELDDEARRWWGREDEARIYSERSPEDIELYQGRGGRRLLSLADCLRARELLRS